MKDYRARHALSALVVAMSLAAFVGTPAVAGAAENETIGVIGCSNTRQHIEGYYLHSEMGKFWDPANLKYGGGTLAAWASELSDQNPAWREFSSTFQAEGADSVWIQLCIRSAEASAAGMTLQQQLDVAQVIAEAKLLTGGVPVYVSPLNEYSLDDCRVTGPFGVSNAAELADWAAASGLAFRGPDTGPLDHSQLAEDQCHLGTTGIDLVGQQMVDFFDHVAGEAPVADFVYSPLRPRVGDDVFFQDVSRDDGTIVSWSWSFGNGVVRNTRFARIQYEAAGTYEVALSVSDDDNNTTVITKLITVGRSLADRAVTAD